MSSYNKNNDGSYKLPDASSGDKVNFKKIYDKARANAGSTTLKLMWEGHIFLSYIECDCNLSEVGRRIGKGATNIYRRLIQAIKDLDNRI